MSSVTGNFRMQHMDGTKVTREPHIADTIVFVDGFTGDGETMWAPIVASLDRVELMKISYHLKSIVGMTYLNVIREDVAISVIGTWADLD